MGGSSVPELLPTLMGPAETSKLLRDHTRIILHGLQRFSNGTFLAPKELRGLIHWFETFHRELVVVRRELDYARDPSYTSDRVVEAIALWKKVDKYMLRCVEIHKDALSRLAFSSIDTSWTRQDPTGPAQEICQTTPGYIPDHIGRLQILRDYFQACSKEARVQAWTQDWSRAVQNSSTTAATSLYIPSGSKIMEFLDTNSPRCNSMDSSRVPPSTLDDSHPAPIRTPPGILLASQAPHRGTSVANTLVMSSRLAKRNLWARIASKLRGRKRKPGHV